MTDEANRIDRALQRELLIAMRATYPETYACELAANPRPLFANLLYLEEHGLCDAGLKRTPMGDGFAWRGARITARGIDFLAEDGGLSAILGVVTVRLHADTIRDLLAAKIDATPLPTEEKSALKRHLAALPETALRAATTELVKLGLTHLPDAAAWLRILAGL